MTDTARPADPQSKLTSEGAVAESPTSFQGSFGDYDLIGHPFKNGAGENSWHITCRAAGRSSAKTYCVIGKEFFSIGCEAGAPIEQGLNDNKPIQRLDDSDLDPQEREAILEATRKWQSSS
jgi:hypothetical protein